MKHIIFFLAIVGIIPFVSMEVVAQDYNPLIRNNTFWDVMKASSFETCIFYDGGRYFFDGDTVLDGKKYEIVRSFPILSLASQGYCPPYAVDGNSINIKAFMREDTLSKQIFLFDEWLGDVLLYDFSLDVKDTLVSPLMPPMIVDSIGYIILENGEQRKIIHFNYFQHEYIIESIGGSSGLCYPLPNQIDMYNVPGCVLDNGELIYNSGDDWGLDCYTYVGLNDFIESKSAVLYPNPVKTGKYLTLSIMYAPIQITIIDAQGRIVYIIEAKNSDNLSDFRIEINDLEKGIYFIEVLTLNNFYYYEKFIVID